MEHYSVLLHEAIDALDIKSGGTYVDLTLGRGGHSAAILRKLKEGHLYCFDKDASALKESSPRLEKVGSNFTLIQADFSSVKEALAKEGVTLVDGIIADLGVSSPQFDDPSRGFSYRYEARLDMRMDQSQALDAYEVVNSYPLERLIQILRDYGDEKDAYKIASNIVKRRQIKPIVTTFDLVDVVKESKTQKELSKKGHPAKQTFQAIRVEVNGEMKALEKILEVAPSLLSRGGRLAIITFNSNEDRLVKTKFASLSVIQGDRKGFLRPEDIQKPQYSTLTHKPITPSQKELEENNRSLPAKLRVLIRN